MKITKLISGHFYCLTIFQSVLIIILISTHSLYSQTDTINNLICDSVVMKNGSTQMLNVQEINSKNIVYFLCCDGCAVPRKLSKNEIDSVYLNPNKGKHFSQETREACLLIKRVDSNKDPVILYDKSTVIVKTKDAKRYKGSIEIVNTTTIRINGIVIPLDEINTLKKPMYGLKSFGFIAGTVTFIASLATIDGDPFDGIFLVIVPPLYTLMLAKKKYKINDKWLLKVRYI